jgi:hypothetical protein
MEGPLSSADVGIGEHHGNRGRSVRRRRLTKLTQLRGVRAIATATRRESDCFATITQHIRDTDATLARRSRDIGATGTRHVGDTDAAVTRGWRVVDVAAVVHRQG